MEPTRKYVDRFLAEASTIIDEIDKTQISLVVEQLQKVKQRSGRIFFLGSGGSAGNASHAVNDFRNIAGIEAYAPTDNVSELTARVNDDGWDTVFSRWLETSKLNENDLLFVLSVGGGDIERNISPNIVAALNLAKAKNASIVGVVGRDGGATAQLADASVIIPTISNDTVTPHAEAFQAVIWHLLVTHPSIIQNDMKWESQK